MSLPIICLSIYFMYLLVSIYFLYIHPFIHPCMNVRIDVYLSIHTSIYVCMYLSIYPFIYQSMYVCEYVCTSRASLVAQTVKNLPATQGDLDSIPGLGRSPGREHGNPLQNTCLENPHGQRNLAGSSPWGCRVRHNWMTKLSTCIYPSTYLSACLSVIYPCMYVCMYVCIHLSTYHAILSSLKLQLKENHLCWS